MLDYTCRCAMTVVDTDAAVDEVCLNHVFKVQEDCFLYLGKIEEQLMRR